MELSLLSLPKLSYSSRPVVAADWEPEKLFFLLPLTAFCKSGLAIGL